MAFTDEALKAKLSTLNESQDSIVSVSQWIMFHRRHADRIASFWLQRLRDSNAAKRLNLLYLVNEIVQNSRARRKDDFPDAFSPVMPEAAQTAYRSSSTDVQQKIRRLIEVWRSRSVFESPIQDAIEARLDEIDKSRPTGKKPLMGGSLFGAASGSGGLPNELESLAPLQLAVSKANVASISAVGAANTEYSKLNDEGVQLPAPPLFAARLSALLKNLASAESSVLQSIQARQSLLAELEKISAANRASLETDEASLEELRGREAAMDIKRREVEDDIRRTANAEPPGIHGRTEIDGPMDERVDRPEYEGLTPPPVEALTPVGSPGGDIPSLADDPLSAVPIPTPETAHNPDIQLLLASVASAEAPTSTQGQSDGHTGSRTAGGTNGTEIGPPTSKKRKMSHTGIIRGNGGGAREMPLKFDVELDLDEDVAEMIRQESGGAASVG